jgi:branched-chain amino acid transport system substrate-binding protein
MYPRARSGVIKTVMRMLRKMVVITIACLLWSGLALGADTTTAPSAAAPSETGQLDIPAPEPINLGTWAPLSGPMAPWGAMARGMEVYFMQVTAEGGINGRPIKLFMFDNKYDPNITQAGVMTLVEQKKVFAMVGGVGTEAGLSVKDYLIKKNVPWIGPAAGHPGFVDPMNRLVFAVLPDTRSEAAALVKYSVEVLNRKKIAFIYQKDKFGLAGLQGASWQCAAHNIELIAKIEINPQDLDLTTEIMDLKDADPQTVILWLGPAQAALLRKTEVKLAKAGRKTKFAPVWMTGSFLADSVFMHRVTGGLWEGTVYVNLGEPPESDTRLMAEYRRAFEDYAVPGEKFTPFFYAGFGLAEPLVEALRQCRGEITVDNLVTRLEALKDFKGIMGKITYGPDRRQGQKEMYICQSVTNGGVRPLTGWFVLEPKKPAPKPEPTPETEPKPETDSSTESKPTAEPKKE